MWKAKASTDIKSYVSSFESKIKNLTRQGKGDDKKIRDSIEHSLTATANKANNLIEEKRYLDVRYLAESLSGIAGIASDFLTARSKDVLTRIKAASEKPEALEAERIAVKEALEKLSVKIGKKSAEVDDNSKLISETKAILKDCGLFAIGKKKTLKKQLENLEERSSKLKEELKYLEDNKKELSDKLKSL